ERVETCVPEDDEDIPPPSLEEFDGASIEVERWMHGLVHMTEEGLLSMTAKQVREFDERLEALIINIESVKAAVFMPAPTKSCRKCHGIGTITGKKTGTTVDCDCVK